MNKKRGFTLVELLVVIAVIALLLSILMPVLKKAQDQAKRILCGNHIKNMMYAITMYADTHDNKIPYTAYGAWPWDVSLSITTELLRNMGTDTSTFTGNVPVEFGENFYCPANSQQRRYRDAYWNYSLDPTTGYRVLGYAFMWKAIWNTTTAGVTTRIILGKDGITADPSKKWVNRTDMPQASEVDLIVDATLSIQVPDTINYPKGNFAIIATGTTPGGTANCTNHLVTAKEAAGGNVGFADNHVEWRPFTEMMHRITITTNPTTSGSTTLWWWW
jgi:prepilin-type N-terminal cleavage/methylation domain-containing protein/prepilin-type processing-associated H-X9-DG protein